MAHPSRFDVHSAALLTTCLALLASPLACQSDEQDDANDDATTQVESLAMGNTGAAGTAGMASSSGNPPAGAAANSMRPPANASPAEQSPAAPLPTSTPNASSNAAAETALTFAACTYSEGNYGRNCDSLYVTMKQVSPARCVQLSFDNCGEYGRNGLSVDVPMPWRLDSGTVSSNLNECELGVFYPSSSVALRASGSATWNETTRLPSELVLDLSLELSTSAGDDSIEVTATTPITPFVCND